MLHEVVRFDTEFVGELFHSHAFRERNLAARLLELENFRRYRCRLLARIATRGWRLRLLFLFSRLRQHDVRPDVLGNDLSSREWTFREELRVDFQFARFLHSLAGGFFLDRTFFEAFVGRLFASCRCAGWYSRGWHGHR